MTFIVVSSHDMSSSSWDMRGKLQRGGVLVVASSHLGLRRHCLLSTNISRRPLVIFSK
ncbi:hypothetical protein Bca52824_039314 [Brassica carinata]|uniref:Uncharacterized protein n=1 Tax=Brassica carinata TaxID=52824 RepID=A0A8X7RTG2_BRACI|nr:hypothetical protein Bca52824_039314 [Brassica carinata]